MIKSFANKETEDVFHGIHTHHIRIHLTPEILKKAEKRLDLLNCADSLESLSLIPAMKEDALVRDAHGKYSIPVFNNWRIAFRWEKDGPADVEIKT